MVSSTTLGPQCMFERSALFFGMICDQKYIYYVDRAATDEPK